MRGTDAETMSQRKRKKQLGRYIADRYTETHLTDKQTNRQTDRDTDTHRHTQKEEILITFGIPAENF